jgi:hypothetical protein
MLLRTFRHKVVVHDYIINLLRIYAAGFIVYNRNNFSAIYKIVEFRHNFIQASESIIAFFAVVLAM